MLEHRAVGGAAQREHPGARGKLVHREAVQPAARRDGQPGDEQQLVAGVEGGQHVEAERRADEPRRGERGGGPDVVEAERLSHRVRQTGVEDAQHDRGGAPALAELVAHRQARLQVGQIVAGQHRDRGGDGQPRRGQHLGQRRVGDHHGDFEGAQLAQVPVVLVLLHHDHVLAGVAQLAHHAQAHRAEPDDKHVAAQPGDLPPPE